MSHSLKVVVIGGGSSYTPEFIEGLIKRHNEFPVSELWLVDIDSGIDKLKIIHDLAQRMVREAGNLFTIFMTTNRKEALKSADFVTTQIRVGQLEARVLDERIPLSHGILGQETNGAGGLFKGLRTIPVLMRIANDMKQYCPDAWLINFTNPAGMVTEALLRYSDHKKVVGICNIPVHTTYAMAKLLKVKPSEIEMDFAGLNHFVYGTDVRVNGQSVLKEALELLSMPENQLTMKNIAPIPWSKLLLTQLGVIPCPYHRYYYKSREVLNHAITGYKSGGTRAEKVQRIEEELFELYQDPQLSIKPTQLEQRGGAYYSDAACNLLSSIYNDKGDIQVVNVKNGGAIPFLDDEVTIEINCRITKDGPIPISNHALPDHVKGLIQQLKSFEKTAVEAAVKGSYDLGVAALIMHPLVSDEILAVKVFDELLSAHSSYLPQFSTSEVTIGEK